MDRVTFENLQYQDILKELSRFATTEEGRRQAQRLTPHTSFEKISSLFSELEEAARIVTSPERPQLSDIEDITPLLKAHIRTGASLGQDKLLKLKKTLKAMASLKALLSEPFRKEYPTFFALIDSLSTSPALTARLEEVFDDEGFIKDTASLRLMEIREELSEGRTRLRSLFERLVKKSPIKDYLREEVPFSIIDDRLVLCVKATYYTSVKGIIQGRSSTEATYYIEPFEAVELNNRVSVLKKEEQEEVERILRELTAMVREESQSLVEDMCRIAKIDLLLARAELMGYLDATIPTLKKGGTIRLKGARHPLLVVRELKGELKVVPVDIVSEKEVLIISGANSGGKTVTLKTLGLSVLMAQTGLAICAKEGSELVVFEKVFTDIGDRQDITEDISTFTGHMQRVSAILREATDKSLVLIDEIGTGTDPQEGGALAIAVLEELRQRGTRTVATTHINTIKAYALKAEGFQNASVMFDRRTHTPLYRLNYGLPGESLALEVAARFGIPEEVIKRAETLMDRAGTMFLKALKEVEEEKRRLSEIRRELEELERRKERALERLREEREKLVESARERVERLIKRAEKRIRELEEKEKATKKSLKEGLKGLRRELTQSLGPEKIYIPREGDMVIIKGRGLKGKVLKVWATEKRAELLLEKGLKIAVDCKDIEEFREEKKREGAVFTTVSTSQVPIRINLIGKRSEEAIRELERAIDKAHMNGVEKIEVIHGIGTGRLRRAIREYLSENSLVRGFHSPPPHEGGEGVTIVEIR